MGLSGDKSESSFKNESGIGNIKSIMMFNSLETKTTPKDSIKERYRIFLETALSLKLSTKLYPFLNKNSAIGAARNI